MTEYTADQLLLERKMQEEGELAYARRARQAREKDRLTLLPSGRAALRHSLGHVEKEIIDWLERAQNGPGRDHEALPYLEGHAPHLLALLATAAVVDGLHRPRSATALGGSIGRAVEDEARFGAVLDADPMLFKGIQRETRRSGPAHRRRVAIYRARCAGLLPKAWPNVARTKVGLVLLEAVERATGWIECINRTTGPKRSQLMVEPTEAAVEWIRKADEHAASISPMFMPTLDPPLDWDGPTGGGYLTDLVLRRPIARFRGRGHEALVGEEIAPPVLAALNKLQRVPWRVNRDVVEVVRDAGDNLPGCKEDPIPPRPGRKEDVDPADWKAWRISAGLARRRNVAVRSRQVLAKRTIIVADEMGDREFYYPHRLDFRSRAYPTPHWLSPQGPDMARAMVHFGQGVPMTSQRDDELLAYGARLWGEKGTLDGLARQGAELLELGRRVNEDPLVNREWEEADEPFQFLAWCLEACPPLGEDVGMSHLPVHLDASNNGLQLFGLVTGDWDLAHATNAVGGGAPRDLYSDVASEASSELWKAAKEDHPYAGAWAAILPDGIPRACAKRPVMTLPYGVTLWSAQEYVRTWYEETWTDDGSGPLGLQPGKACRYLAQVILDAVHARCRGAVVAMEWLQEVARIAAEANEPLRWTTPSGWPVQQEYRKSKTRRVKAHLGGAVRHLRLREPGAQVDRREQAQGAAPNFIHSIDAAILHLTLHAWPSGRPISTVHDSYATLAPSVGDLRRGLNEAVARATIDFDPLSRLAEEVRAYTGSEVPDPPRVGEIDRAEVIAAENMFQ